MTVKEKFSQWISRLSPEDPMFQELQKAADDPAEIEDRFYCDLTFGTAGLRGKCGAGTNRMNRLTVARATQGIANFLKISGMPLSRGVIIAFDCRHFSKEFAVLTAEILTGNGCSVYLFPELRPTPELSFTLRRLHAVAGINLTASHNPKEYNGYKVYWEDGAQISGEVSDGIQRQISALSIWDRPSQFPWKEAEKAGLLHILGAEDDRAYLNYVEAQSLRPSDELDLSIPIVYTPLNGAGSIPVQTVFSEMHYKNFHIVPEQKDPDPNFTTVGYPNPEDPKAFAFSERLGKFCHAELLIATDPDSDRMAVEVIDQSGNYKFLNGNQTGGLLLYYLAKSRTEKGTIPSRPAMVKSIVTGDFGRAICRTFGIAVFEALTGFKNICGRIPELQKKGYSYFFGYEESIGCAPSDCVRDKDGITAALLIAEMAAWYRKKGLTLLEALHSLYQEYGWFAEQQTSIIREGEEGANEIRNIMQALRQNLPKTKTIGSFTVRQVIDYQNGYQDIPASNVLKYLLEGDTWFAVRPSGTEPKLKFYFYTCQKTEEEAEQTIQILSRQVLNDVNQI